MSTAQEQHAKSILTHYFKLASQGEWNWNGDNRAEIEGAVEAIIAAAQRPLLKRIEELEKRIGKLEKEKDFKY